MHERLRSFSHSGAAGRVELFFFCAVLSVLVFVTFSSQASTAQEATRSAGRDTGEAITSTVSGAAPDTSEAITSSIPGAAPDTSNKLTSSTAHAAPDTGKGLAVAIPQKQAEATPPSDSVITEEEIPFDISADNLRGKAGTEEDFLLLEGNVRIVHGTTVARGATGIYFRKSRMATLGGGVTIVDGKTVMTARRATYSLQTETATLQENVRIKNADVIMTGAMGEFRRKDNVAVMSGNVTMVDSTRKIDADRVVYHRDTELAEATGNVVAYDRPNDATVTGGEVSYNRRTQLAVVTSSPKLVTMDKKGKQTTVVGEEMEFLIDKNIFTAKRSVHINREDMEATCQLAEFFRDENRAALSGAPRAWDKDGEILGDSLALFNEGDQIRSVMVFKNAQVFYRAPAEQAAETSLVRGDSIRIMMENEDVSEVFVYGHAQSDYYSAAENKPTSNTATGQTLHLEVRERKPYKATFEGETSGKYYFSTASGDSFKTEEVDYSSEKKIEFFINEHLINLTGQAELKYKNLRLVAEQVEFNSDKQTLQATGGPILWENEQKVTGDRMTYSLQSARGTIFNASTKFEQGFYTGNQIRKVGEKVLDVRVGNYTTCDLKEPHYHFTSSKMKVYANDKVIAKPLVLYVRDVPILALPFYVFPIKPGRHSGILIPQIEFGINQNRGRFIRNAGYYWAINDYADATAWLDYFENEPRWIGYLEGRYQIRYKLSGYLNTSYSRNEAIGKSQWDLRASHLQNLGEGLNLSMEGDFVSDKNYRLERGLGRDFEERVNSILRSTMSLTKRWSTAQLTAAYDRTDYMNTTPNNGVNELKKSELRPTISLTLQNKAIGRASRGGEDKGRLPWLRTTYLSASSFLVSDSKEYEQGEQTHTGVSTRINLRDARKIGTLNISPGFSYTDNWYDKDVLGNKYQHSGVWSASVAGSATLFRVFMLNLGPLSGLRHSFSPSVQFSYQPDFPNYSYVDSLGIRRNRFPSFSSISTSFSKNQSLALSFYNRVQAKLKWKDKVIKLDDLLDFNISTSYDFLYKQRHLPQGFSDINTSVRLKPANNLSSELFLTHNPVTRRMTSLNFVSYLSFQTGKRAAQTAESQPAAPGGQILEEESARASVDVGTQEQEISLPPLQGSLTFRYSRGEDRSSASYWVDGGTSFNLTPNWRVEYSAHYDLKLKEVISQTFSLYRDLHCWEAVFIRRFSGERWEYYFKINIKAHKEIYLERGTAVR